VARWRSGNVEVCKTSMRRFDSGTRLLSMNTIQDLLLSYRTQQSSYIVSEEDKKNIAKSSLADWVTAKLVSGKFRKAPIFPQTRQIIHDNVVQTIKKNEPFYLIICFGGYKHFWNPSHPNVDWAELFHLHFMIDYVRPILSVYQPGVILDYESEDYILPHMNNYPEKRSDAYEDSFRSLVNFIQPSIPTNFQIRYIRAKNQYNTNVIFDRLETRVAEKLVLFDKLPEERKEILLHKTEQNIMWNGKKDLTHLTPKERHEFIRTSRCTDEAFLELDLEIRNNYFVGGNHIPLVLSWGLSADNIDHWLTIGSTYSSSVDFWIGKGIIEDRGTKMVPRILSHTQYDAIKDQLVTIPIKNIPMQNFQSIEVYKGSLNP
jgi:hypothetical protein